MIYPESQGIPGVVLGVSAPGPCVVEHLYLDSDELGLNVRYYPMAFPARIPNQATSVLEPILAAGKHLLRSADSDGRGIRAGFVGFGDPRRFFFWPRVRIEWPTWVLGLVIGGTPLAGVFSAPVELRVSCSLDVVTVVPGGIPAAPAPSVFVAR